MITFTLSGSTDNTRNFLQKMNTNTLAAGIDALAQRGVEALRANTPAESGLTAASWTYEVEVKPGNAISIYWINTHVENGVNIAVILQYGHGTGTGGYVAGRDYIMPAIQPIFDDIAGEVWKKVTTA